MPSLVLGALKGHHAIAGGDAPGLEFVHLKIHNWVVVDNGPLPQAGEGCYRLTLRGWPKMYELVGTPSGVPVVQFAWRWL